MEVQRTKDGTKWQQVGPAGFGTSYNEAPYWDNSMIVFDNTLHVGTFNPTDGDEVWQSVCYTARKYLPLILDSD